MGAAAGSSEIVPSVSGQSLINLCHAEPPQGGGEDPAVRRCKKKPRRTESDCSRIDGAMKKISVMLAFVLQQICALGQTPTPRPRILGIDHVSFYTTAPDGVKKLYGDLLGLTSVPPVEPGGTLRYTVGKQWVGFSPAPDPKSTDRLDHVVIELHIAKNTGCFLWRRP